MQAWHQASIRLYDATILDSRLRGNDAVVCIHSVEIRKAAAVAHGASKVVTISSAPSNE